MAYLANDPGGGWSGWASLGGIITGSPNGDLDGTGNINIFVVNPNANPFYDTEANGWAGWTFLGGAVMYTPTIGMNFDGRQEIFGLTGAGVYHNWQLAPSGPWSGWALLTTPSNSGDTNGADLSYFATNDELASDFAAAQNTCQGKTAPGWLGTPTTLAFTWPCGARVNIGITGYHQKGLKWAHNALGSNNNDGWNDRLFAYYYTNYSLIPVQLFISGGGPQSMWVHPVKDSSIQTPQNPYTRAVTSEIAPDTQGRRFSVETEIIRSMTNEETLTTTLAHELGHTFGLDDCIKCGSPVNNPPFPYHIASWSVMDDKEPWPPGSNGFDGTAKNFTQGLHGPSACDVAQIAAHVYDYKYCGMAETSPPPDQPTCTDGSRVGFLDTGHSSQYTCNNKACDGCNSACSNFAPQNCSSPPPPTCSNWCGNVCMDSAVCSCPGEAPSCQENSGGYFPACNNSCSPVVIDAFNEGFHLTDMNHGVKFRIAPNGPLLQMS